MDKTTIPLDNALRELAQSDSAIQYAPHIRICFDVVVEEIIKLRQLAGENLLYDNLEEYLEFYFGEDNNNG